MLPYDVLDEDGSIFNDHTNEAWITVLDIKDGQNLFGWANNLKTYGRTYYFSENSIKAKAVVIEIDDNHGGTYTQIGCIKFFEDAENLGVGQFDTYIYASASEPFKATIACGSEVLVGTNQVRSIDKTILLKKSIYLDAANFSEMSRNYIYLAPYDEVFEQGRIKYQYQKIGKILHKNQTQNIVVISSTKKIHYGSIDELEKETLGLLGPKELDIVSEHSGQVTNSYFDHNMGKHKYPLYFQNVIKGVDEYPDAYKFYNNGTSFISPNASLVDLVFPGSNKHPYSNDCTAEMSFKWDGPTADSADSYYVLFDQGYNSSRGWSLSYHNRKKCFALYWHNKGFAYSIPFNAEGGEWHYISVSVRNKNIYVYIDGKCLLSTDQAIQYAPAYRFWMLGRWIHTNGYPWYGGIKDFRYTIGTARYQGEDYDPEDNRGSLDLIGPGTLWYNSDIGCVQLRMNGLWYDSPLLPIGHIDTGWKEHLLTDQPRGTYHIKGCKNFDPSGWKSETQYNTSHTAECLFNFGHGGEYPYATTNNTTIEHDAVFTLTDEREFERLRFVHTTWDWRSYPCVFEFGYLTETETTEGEGDEATTVVTDVFTPLVSQTEFPDDGGFYQATKANGDSEVIQGYKTYTFNQDTPAKKYMIKFLPKSEVLYYKDYGHTSARIMLTYKDAKPEVLTRTSYVIGDKWEYGPIPINVAIDCIIPVPFENIPYNFDGEVEEEADFQLKRRKIGITNYNVGASKSGSYVTGVTNYCSGELVYTNSDSVHICTANNYLSPYIGRWNNNTIATSSTKANYYIVLKRKF